ncbi:MAG TPA: hypothetical protein PLO44_01480 [Candidatus Paceibacterota bacterium]|nr:hypothetical protein [Candidatus Paceibacterota bacterium]
MIYLFAGDDAKTKRKTYEDFIDSISKKEADIFFIGKNDFTPIQIESFYSGNSLFSSKSFVFFENIFERQEFEDFILEKLDLIKDSSNDFVFLEGKLDKKTIDAFKKVRTELSIFELPKEKREKFNSFLLADAFADRDKLKLWIYFRQAMDLDVVMEELVGILFWKAKDMILKNNFRKFKLEELQKFCEKISYLLPEARKRGLDDEAVFEQFLLEFV